MAAQLKVTQIKSVISEKQNQRDTLRSLGLKRIGVLIGEIRDQETAQIAIEAALTGHLVLSTLHTNDAPSAITRLIEPAGVGRLGILHDDLAIAPGDDRPGAARTREEAQLADREVAVEKQLAHHGADLPGGADDAHIHRRHDQRPVPA